MKSNKGWFKIGFDKRRTEFKKGNIQTFTQHHKDVSRKLFIENNPMHNKKIKQKWLNSMKNKVWNNKERNTKISESHKGKIFSEQHIENLKNSHLGNINSDESKEKNRIKQIELMKNPVNREKRRIARQKQILLNGGGPTYGTNETQILDELELNLGYKIIRQFTIKGYWIDGYIKDLNIAIEIDEKPKNKKRDIIRQNEIENELNCKFLRIEDYLK